MKLKFSLAMAVFSTVAISSCATLSDSGKRVKIVDPSELAEVKAKCVYKGELSGSGEADDATTGAQLAAISLRNKAAEMRANIVVSRMRPEKSFGMLAANNTINGIGFFCPPAVAEKLMNAESM